MKLKLLSLLILCSISSLVYSQETPRDSIKRITKDDIIIESSRTPERKIDIPMGVSAVSKEQFESTRNYELKDALSLVPGVFSQSRSGTTDNRITIRGFGARGAGDRSNAGNLRGIRILVDGIPETEPDGRTSLDNVDLSSYASLEVLRSNASTLYGSAAGGVISLHSNTNFTDPFVSAFSRFGSFGFMKNTISAGAANSSSHIFANFSTTSFDGYREHSKSSTGNANLFIQTKLSDHTNLNVIASAASNIFRFPGPQTFSQFQSDPLKADSTYTARDEHRFNRVGKFAVVIEHEIAEGHSIGGSVYLQPKLLTRSERSTWREFNRYSVGSSGKYSWLEHLSPTSTNNVLAGFDQQYQDGTIQFFVLGQGASRGTLAASLAAGKAQSKSEAASNVGMYFQDEFVTGDLTLILGGRYDILRYKYEDFFGIAASDKAEFTAFTPKFAAGYKLGKDHSLYVAYGGGLEAPAFNEVDPPDSALIVKYGGIYNPNAAFNPILKPAKSTSIEFGAKGISGFDGALAALSYDAAVFMINITGDIIPWNGGSFYFTAGKTRRIGAEFALAAYTDFGLSLRSAFTYMDAKYVEYENQLGTFNDNKQSGIPSFFGTLKLRYDFDFGLYAEAGMNHVGEYYADDRNDKLPGGNPDPNTNSLAPAYTLFDLTAGFSHTIGDALDLKLYAGMANLTDQKYVSSVFINGTNNKYFESGMPRNFVGGVSLSYRFTK